MTPLKPSEKRLLTILGVAAFLLLNLLGYSWLKKRNLALTTQQIKLESRARELEMWKARAPEAEKKRTWLDQHLQAYAGEAARETYLDRFVLQQVQDLDLTIRKNQPMPVKMEPLFHKSRYQAEVTGEWDNVLEFIFRLQNPEEFRFVPSLSLKSQKKEGSTDPNEPSNAVCTFEVQKWWSPESLSSEDFLLNAAATEIPQEASPAPPEPASAPATGGEQTAAARVESP